MISYSDWRRNQKARGWKDWRYWAVLLVVWMALVWLGGMWSLLLVPAVMAVDYGWTCMRIARLPDPPVVREA